MGEAGVGELHHRGEDADKSCEVTLELWNPANCPPPPLLPGTAPSKAPNEFNDI